MERIFRWIFGVGGLLLLALALVWGVSKLVGPSRAERAALATMSEPVQFTGRNAYPAIWLMDYPVPADEIEAVMTEDVRRMAEMALPHTDQKPVDYTTAAGGSYPSDRPDQMAMKRLCRSNEDCLAKVRSDLPGYEKLLSEHVAWFARAEQATHADHLSNPFPPRVDMPLPSFVSTYAPATLFAVRFAQGQRATAIASTCKAIVDWRKLGSHSDLLVGWAVARGYGAQGYGQLLAQMLAETPNSESLPVECADAMAAPKAAEISMCPAMRGEFNFISQSIASTMQAGASKHDLERKVFFDAEMTKAMMAVPMAKYCSEETDAAFAADKTPLPTKELGMYRLQCASNTIGCILARIAEPGYQGFELGHRDGLAMKRALAALAWWRNQPDAAKNPDATLKSLPAAYRAAAHPFRLNAEKTALVMPTLQENKEEIVLPLPGSRVAAPVR